jgi:hypothetical protein
MHELHVSVVLETVDRSSQISHQTSQQRQSITMSFTADSDSDSCTGSTQSDVDTVAMKELGPYDVICGRHKEAFNNIGNRRFRVTVSLNKDRYAGAPSRKEKTGVIKCIVGVVKSNGGRFLQRVDGAWVELDEKKSLAKVGHAIRDMVESTSTSTVRSQASSAILKKKASCQRCPSPEVAIDNVPCLPQAAPTVATKTDCTMVRRDSVDSLMLAWLADDSDWLLDSLVESIQADDWIACSQVQAL